jgi:hypothetical protein
MELESSLPCSQDPCTGPYPEPNESSPCTPSYLSKILLNIVLPAKCRCSSPGRSIKILMHSYSPVLAKCPAPITFIYLILNVMKPKHSFIASFLPSTLRDWHNGPLRRKYQEAHSHRTLNMGNTFLGLKRFVSCYCYQYIEEKVGNHSSKAWFLNWFGSLIRQEQILCACWNNVSLTLAGVP